jgi:iron complex outermembrane receptor protein
MRKFSMFLTGLMLLATISQGQKISGVVKDHQGKALEKSTVSLLRAKDSSVVKLGVTGDQGKYTLLAEPGNYLVSASFVGYEPAYSAEFEVRSDIQVPEIVMNKQRGDLTAVTVTAQRPIIEVKADKTILNVEGTINAVGNDGLELLRRAPGVMIDKDDNISLAGKTGVQIFIDGKPSPLSGADLANYLKSMQSAQIEAIEIITNPSARFEAAGNAGIINIKLKKNKSYGANGTVNLGYNQGYYGKFNSGINMNYRNQKVNLFGSYNYNNGKYRNQFHLYREQFDSIFDQRNTMVFHNNTHGFKGGIDYFINQKSTLGAMVTGNIANNDFNTSGPLYITYKPTMQLDRILRASNLNDMERTNVNTNLNYRYSVTGGSDLNIDADYGIFRIRSNQFQPNYYYHPDGTTEIYRSINRMISPTDINLFSFKTDYEKNAWGGRLSLGTKISMVETDNNFSRYDVLSSGEVLDEEKSNLFKYKENINALYVNFNRQMKGWMFQVGLRGENTHSEGNSIGKVKRTSGLEPYDSVFNRDYTDLFPSASLTLNKNPMKQWTFSYSRRIDRPAYQDLNPFEFKLNEYTYMKGNTQLRPQYTNSFGITHIYKYKLTIAANYSHVADIFAQVPDTIDKTKGFLTKKNMDEQDVVSLNISYPFQKKWYSFFATTNMNYSNYKANFGGGDRNINQGVFSYTFFMQNSAKFGKGWTAELSGLYISKSIWQGFFRSKAMGTVDAGIQKTILKGAGNLKVSVGDIFQTMKWGGTSNFTGVNGRVSGRGEMPQFKMNFTYRFGNSQVKAARQRKSSAEEEIKRTEGGGQGMGQQR